jgi:hypothetical protein
MNRFSAISWQEEAACNEMILISALYSINTLNWVSTVLAHWNNSPWVEMSLHLDTLSTLFPANQSLHLLLNYTFFLAEKQIKKQEKGNRRGNQEWTIHRNWQHRVQKTQDEDKQNKKHNVENLKQRASRVPPKTGTTL